MSTVKQNVARLLNLRPGEGRVFAAMAAFLLLTTANATFLSSAKNGLFLSVYEADLIPHAIIAAALVTAVVAVIFAGVVVGTSKRRRLAVMLTIMLGLSLLASRAAFELNERSAFVLYLWLSTVQVLIMTHAWDYVGGMLTGRQGKRLLPLIGMGASVGAIFGGASVVPVSQTLGTSNMLLISTALLGLALPCLWAADEPTREPDPEGAEESGIRALTAGASRGFRSIGREPLLRLMAFGLIALTATGTLIDLQLKIALKEAFTRDDITAVYGVMSSVVGAGTLIVQFWASRSLFPKFGVSFAARLQGGTLALASAGAAVVAGYWLAFAALQALDDVLQFSLQKPVEQVSLLPFSRRVKSAAAATFGGVLRPMSKAGAGALTLLLVDQVVLLRLATILSAATAFMVYLGHRRRYLASLEGALARHTVDFGSGADTTLVVDKEALGVIDRGLEDPDATVAVFAVSLLAGLPAEEALPRVRAMFQHEVPEVRAEAARVAARLDAEDDAPLVQACLSQLAEETSAFVIASLLDTIGELGGVDPSTVEAYLDHEAPAVRRAALVAAGRLESPRVDGILREHVGSEKAQDRMIGASAAGALGREDLVEEVAALLEDVDTRPAALMALADIGGAAIPVLSRLLGERSLPLPLRRSIITVLAGMPSAEATEVLLSTVEEPALGPAAITSLGRMRKSGSIEPIDPDRLRPSLVSEIRKGYRFARAATELRKQGRDDRSRFVAEELEGLRERTIHRVVNILSLSFDHQRLSVASAGLRASDITGRSNALELVEGILPTETARLVMPFLEGPGGAYGRFGEPVTDPGISPVEALLNEPDWWPQALALHALGRDDEISTPGRAPTEQEEGARAMIPLIEKVMILKGSQLFRSFPGPELAGIASLAEVVHLEPGETVFEQDDQGDAFYMVVNGSVRITRGSHELALLGSREGFGEMAILDQQSRSATATAAEATTLLRIDRDSFDRLIEQNPAVARGIYRVLTRRLRNTLAQVAAG